MEELYNQLKEDGENFEVFKNRLYKIKDFTTSDKKV